MGGRAVLGSSEWQGQCSRGSATLGQVIWELTVPLSLSNHQNWNQDIQPQICWNIQFPGGMVGPWPSWRSCWSHNMGNRFQQTAGGWRSLSPTLGPLWLGHPLHPFCCVFSELSPCDLFLRACACELWVSAGLRTKGARLSVVGSSISIPEAEKMQNNPTLSKWQDHYFFTVWNYNLA